MRCGRPSQLSRSFPPLPIKASWACDRMGRPGVFGSCFSPPPPPHFPPFPPFSPFSPSLLFHLPPAGFFLRSHLLFILLSFFYVRLFPHILSLNPFHFHLSLLFPSPLSLPLYFPSLIPHSPFPRPFLSHIFSSPHSLPSTSTLTFGSFLPLFPSSTPSFFLLSPSYPR